MANGTKIWVVTKNGNFVMGCSNKDKSVAEMRTLAKAPKADISDQKDGSVRLKGVAHYRSKEVAVS